MASPFLAYQTAVYGLLDAGLTCEVYDSVPPGAAYPYVVIDSVIAANADTLNERKDDAFLYLSVWSNKDGQFEVHSIIEEIEAALHNQRPTLSTGRAVILRVNSTRTMRESDGRTFQGQVVIRCTLEH